jgi:hypothetical protein
MKDDPRRNLLFISAPLIIATLILGQVVPRLLISDGMENLTGGAQEFAKVALITTRHLTDNPVETAMQTGLRIVTLRVLADESSGVSDCVIGETPYAGRYEALIRAYTWFGVPYAEILVECSGAARRLP